MIHKQSLYLPPATTNRSILLNTNQFFYRYKLFCMCKNTPNFVSGTIYAECADSSRCDCPVRCSTSLVRLQSNVSHSKTKADDNTRTRAGSVTGHNLSYQSCFPVSFSHHNRTDRFLRFSWDHTEATPLDATPTPI